MSLALLPRSHNQEDHWAAVMYREAVAAVGGRIRSSGAASFSDGLILQNIAEEKDFPPLDFLEIEGPRGRDETEP